MNRKEWIHCRLLSANRPGTCVIQTTKEVERKKLSVKDNDVIVIFRLTIDSFDRKD